VDDLTGQMYGPINPTDTATTTEPVIDLATTSTEPVIVTEELQILPEPPEETADTPTSTTNTQNQNSTTTQT